MHELYVFKPWTGAITGWPDSCFAGRLVWVAGGLFGAITSATRAEIAR